MKKFIMTIIECIFTIPLFLLTTYIISRLTPIEFNYEFVIGTFACYNLICIIEMRKEIKNGKY